MAGLDAGRAALVRLSAAVATRDERTLDEAFRATAAGDPSTDPTAAEEVLLQTHLFVGFPIALEALSRWREVCGNPAPDPITEDPETWASRGPRVCEAVYGGSFATPSASRPGTRASPPRPVRPI